jgi:hypothetical protein
MSAAVVSAVAAALAAAPAPSLPEYQFKPVDPAWRVEEALLQPDADPAESYTMLARKERAQGAGWLTEKRYFDKNGAGRKILRFYPSGRLACEIEWANEAEQHSRWFHPDGALAGYLRWQAGRWVAGYSVSPDGKTWHRLRDGTGEIVYYGQGAGNRRHLFHQGGDRYAEKVFQADRLVKARLDVGGDTLLAERGGPEHLHLNGRREHWIREAGEAPLCFDVPDGPAVGGQPRRGDPEKYARHREQLLDRARARLRAAHTDWAGLGLGFLPDERPWPAD